MFSPAIKTRTAQTNYLTSFTKDQDFALPLLNKVRGKTLCLQSYTLSQAHCKALASALAALDTSVINRLHLENCGIDDAQFASFCEALASLP